MSSVIKLHKLDDLVYQFLRGLLLRNAHRKGYLLHEFCMYPDYQSVGIPEDLARKR